MMTFIVSIGRLSSDGSVASIAATTQEDASNESEILVGIFIRLIVVMHDVLVILC